MTLTKVEETILIHYEQLTWAFQLTYAFSMQRS